MSEIQDSFIIIPSLNFFARFFFGMSLLWNGGIPEPIFVHSLTYNGDENNLLCHSLKFVRNCVLFIIHYQVLKNYKFGKLTFSATKYLSNMTKRPWWLLKVIKTTQWDSIKGIIENCYNLLLENWERTPPWVSAFIGNKKSLPIFTTKFLRNYTFPNIW